MSGNVNKILRFISQLLLIGGFAFYIPWSILIEEHVENHQFLIVIKEIMFYISIIGLVGCLIIPVLDFKNAEAISTSRLRNKMIRDFSVLLIIFGMMLEMKTEGKGLLRVIVAFGAIFSIFLDLFLFWFSESVWVNNIVQVFQFIPFFLFSYCMFLTLRDAFDRRVVYVGLLGMVGLLILLYEHIFLVDSLMRFTSFLGVPSLLSGLGCLGLCLISSRLTTDNQVD